MKRGKDEEKQLEPLFPRIHINDAEKGGPRAPPRNKMALCEQLTIPSNKFTTGSISMLPLLASTSTSNGVTPSTSSSHVGCHKKNMFSPFCSFPESPDLAVRPHPHASGGLNLNSKLIYPELRSLAPINYQTLPMATENNVFQLRSFLSTRNSPAEKIREQDCLRVPSFDQLGRSLTHGNEHNHTFSYSNSFGKLQIAYEKHIKETSYRDFKDIECTGKQAEDNLKVSESSEHHGRKLSSVLPTKGRIITDTASTSMPQDRNANPDTNGVVSTSQKRSSSSQDYKTLQESISTRNGIVENLETFTRKRNASTMENPSCSVQRLEDEHRSPSRAVSGNESSKDQDCGSVLVGAVDKSDGMSDSSAVDSVAGLIVSPDAVMEVIGQKQFWKARKIILHQQRIFELQIFELHRLVKVQKLMAESPELLFKDNLCFGKSSIEFPPMKKLKAENIQEPSSLSLQVKADPQKPNLSMESTAENAYTKPPPLDNEMAKVLKTEQSTHKPCPETLISPPAAADMKLAPLLFQPPPGNQWLIPVRSPSEGLIYKPYTGPCPPPASFLTPVYGSCGPISLAGTGGNFLNTPYCVSASNQQGIGNFPSHTALSQTYFQPFPIPPVISTADLNSTVERTSTLTKTRPTEHDFSDKVVPYQISCNIPSPKRWIISDSGKNLQDSTLGSPPEKNIENALPLFPTTPSIDVSHKPVRSPDSEQQLKVIKVVPHDPESASESAARIFRTIQEERKQHG